MGERDDILDRLEAELRASLERNQRMLDELTHLHSTDEEGTASADRP